MGMRDKWKVGLLLIAMAMIATAGLVNYLSQVATVNAQVKSPIELTFTSAPTGAEISDDGLSVSLPEAIGGSTYPFTVHFKNLANNPVSDFAIKLSCFDGSTPVTCDALEVEVTSDVGLPSQQTYTASCTDGVWTVSEPSSPVPAGFESDNIVDVTIAQNYFGGLGCQMQALLN